jgi:hypothetical protein
LSEKEIQCGEEFATKPGYVPLAEFPPCTISGSLNVTGRRNRSRRTARATASAIPHTSLARPFRSTTNIRPSIVIETDTFSGIVGMLSFRGEDFTLYSQNQQTHD